MVGEREEGKGKREEIGDEREGKAREEGRNRRVWKGDEMEGKARGIRREREGNRKGRGREKAIKLKNGRVRKEIKLVATLNTPQVYTKSGKSGR